MRNRSVGILVVGIAVLMGFIIISFNRALTAIVNTACSHGPACPMWEAIDFQTNISVGIMGFVVAIGVYLFLAKEPAEKRITQRNSQKVMNGLSPDEKRVLERIIEAEGALFQSDLVDKVSLPKAKVTRILDKLEGKNLIERRRRGMSNVVILKVQ